MPLPTPLAISSPNPTIGNGFDTEATVLNTLLTNLKSDTGGVTSINNYLSTTKLENLYIKEQAVQSPQLYLQAAWENFGSNVSLAVASASTTQFLSDLITITIDPGFTNAIIDMDAVLNMTGKASGATSWTFFLEQLATQVSSAGSGTKVLPPSGTALNIVIPEDTATTSRATVPFTALWAVGGPGTYYFKFSGSANSTAPTFNQTSSNYKYKIYNDTY